MTQTAVLAGNEQPVNFLNVYIRSTKPDIVGTVVSKETAANPILDWFEKSSMLELIAFKSIPAGKIFLSDRAIVKFKLSEIYHNHFVLLRGLLDFSRPKQLALDFNNSERTFEIFAGMDQTATIKEYLELNLKLLIQEIKFKKLLKAILRFEESVRVEQARLYKELQTSAL